MKKGNVKIFLGVFTFVLISLFLISFVSAQDGVFKVLWEAFFGGISLTIPSSAFISIQRILLMILVVLVVYSSTDFIPFISDKEGIKWFFSLVVGALTILFVTREFIEGVMVNYEAMGVALTSVIPLVVLLAFSFRISTTIRYRRLSYFLNPLLFSIYGLWMILSWHQQNIIGQRYAQVYLFSALIAFVCAVVLNLFWGRISRWLYLKDILGQLSESGNEQVMKYQTKIDYLYDQLGRETDATRIRDLHNRINHFRNLIKDVIKNDLGP